MEEFDRLYWTILRWMFLGTVHLVRWVCRMAVHRPVVLAVLVFLLPHSALTEPAADVATKVKVGVIFTLLVYAIARRVLGRRSESEVPIVPIDPA